MKMLILVMVSFLAMSCGESPLFNHGIETNKIISHPTLSDSDVQKFKKTDFSFVISWEEGPKMGGSRFLVKTWKNNLGTMNGPYQDLPKTFFIMLWMPSMGHGSSPVKMKKINDGEYEVTDVYFIMNGNWEMKFQLKDGNQVFDETVIPVSL